ncbi:DUF1573 domain-containing protein [Gemmata massiliana]|uniref:DUF1573 domain-containing protein n=1 Tax=Gemmata massiliana TaxID=1210884 RepID=UPI0013A6D8A6|nr:DUF1573 domain-containing protein [Gemmata massiliana]
MVIIAATFAAGAGVVAARWMKQNAEPAPPAPEQTLLTVDSSSLDFGEVWETDKFDWAVPVTNRSANSVDISRWGSSCNCTAVQPSSLRLSPGETKTITVRLDLTQTLYYQQAAQPVAVSLLPIVAEQNSRRSWQLSGTVKPLLRKQPNLVFGPLSAAAQPLSPLQTALSFVQPIETVSVECDSPYVTAVVVPSRDDAVRSDVRVEFRFARTIPFGTHPFKLALRGTFSSPRSEYSTQLQGNVSVVTDVQAQPAEALFAARTVGETCEEEIRLISLTGRPFRIESLTPQGAGLTVQRVNDEPRFVVRQQIVEGSQTKNSVVAVVVVEGGKQALTVPVISTGVVPPPTARKGTEK